MSGWKLVTRALYDAGGGPVQASAFDPFTMKYKTFFECLGRAQTLGMMRNVVNGGGGAHDRGRWQITQRGIDLCEGRVTVIYANRSPKERRSARELPCGLVAVATWLKALPPPNEIRLQGTRC